MSDAREPTDGTHVRRVPGERAEKRTKVNTVSEIRAGSGSTPPRQVVITGSRTRTARSANRPAIAWDINEQTRLGEVYIRSLMRAQLRLAVLVGAGFGFLLGGLPLLFAVLPQLRELRVFGLPLPWLLLGVLVYPMLVAGGWVYVRYAERNEREFARMVERS